MRMIISATGTRLLLAALALSVVISPAAQAQEPLPTSIVVSGERVPDLAELPAGPEIKGVITARRGDRLKVATADGSTTIIAISEATRIKSGTSPFGAKGVKPGQEALLNGLPVTIRTLRWSGGLVAEQISFKRNDLKIAAMIHNGTSQRFEEQSAATEALRGRMGDIDKYNVKSTTNVYFDSGKATLSDVARHDLCAAAASAEATENSLMLVVGYTDSVGSEEYNQVLSEKRAGSVMNYLQQVCRWKPYRMLTPTGMAESDPAADNDTEQGKALNRRVSVSVLVSKALDGM